MFLGSYKPSFDKFSRRIALPKKIRDYLATKEIILSFGFENCIFGFDTKSWEKESSTQIDQPITDKRAREIRRFLFSAATITKLDEQGRFVLPNNLLKHAKIKDPLVIGAGDHFEIWDETIWKKQQKKVTGE